MGQPFFRFKQFTIRQDRTAMKVGTDGVVLGAWADLENAAEILDIGTGTGLIALMAAQRNPAACIDAVEIDPAAAGQAQENISASPWPERIRIHPVSISDFTPDKRYGCIICNPPFFVNSTPTPDTSRTMARHCKNLSHEELADQVVRLLKEDGHFYTILPPIEAGHLADYAHRHRLFVQQITQVIPNPGKSAIRYLMKFGFIEKKIQKTELILEVSRHHLTEEYAQLTKAFYLKL